MYFYVDGYNLLFRFVESKQSLQKQRESIILFLKKEFAALKLSGLLVFDGKHRSGEESGLAYPSPLEVAYAPKGETADHYILERLQFEKRVATVVTDDRNLIRHVQALKVKTLSNSEFLEWIGQKKKKKKGKKKTTDSVDSPQNINRLLKIFESRLGEIEDDFR